MEMQKLRQTYKMWNLLKKEGAVKEEGWEDKSTGGGGDSPGRKGKCEQHKADLDGENCREQERVHFSVQLKKLTFTSI